MDDPDDDFWTTYIASTPGEDADFAGCGGVAGLVILCLLGFCGLALLVGSCVN